MNEALTIPRDEYDRPQAVAKGLADLQAFGRAKAALAVGEHELIPTDHVNCLLKGEVHYASIVTCAG